MTDDMPASDEASGDYHRARGRKYLHFLADVHKRMAPQWYLEIGTNLGRSLAFVTCSSIAIDPVFRLEAPAQGKKPLLLLMQMTSDDAFGSETLRRLDPRIDIAFLDGMHRFEYLLRDLMNAERFMADGGLVFMHDTAPFAANMADRERLHRGPWTGDVWKLLPVLAKYRPDLQVDHLDCAPTGLTLVRGDWRKNDALTRNYDEILATYLNMALEDFGVKRFYAEHELVSSANLLETL